MNVKVGPYVYEVGFCKDPAKKDSSRRTKKYYGALAGICIHEKQEIWIGKDLSPVAKKDTLLHEILHMIWYISGFPTLDDQEEETAVTILTPYVLSMMVDNPEIMEYLLK